MTLYSLVWFLILFVCAVAALNCLVWNEFLRTSMSATFASRLQKLLPGINVLAIVGGAFAVGGLFVSIGNLSERLQSVQSDVRRLSAEVYEDDDNLKLRAARVEDELKRLGPRIVKEDFDREIERLNTEIQLLNSQIVLLEQRLKQRPVGTF